MRVAEAMGCRLGVRWVQAAGIALLPFLAGCGAPSYNPVDWWHNLEGGPIADARPPPPNADAPYPGLGNIPPKPVITPPAQRAQIANGLIADRANAQYDASLAPLPPAAGAPGTGPVPPPPAPGGENASNATLAAASAPARPPTRPASSGPATPKPAPVTAVQSSPLAAPSPPTVSPPAAGAAGAAAAALPSMPERPPLPPSLPGVTAVTVPSPAVPTPPPVVRPHLPVAGAPVAIAFPAGSAVLPSSALPALKQMAQQRGAGSVAVVGFGAAASSAPADQQAAMPLAFSRARAIAGYLQSSGVPASAIRIDAEAVGEGGVVRLIH
jgi:outer membrane protein OmpA-like peptidoglycan-associated protein